jgi:hypothetical protein
MSEIIFSNVALMGTNKEGRLVPDSDGYYELVLGAFDCYNSTGIFYEFDPVRKFFEENSSFQRKIKDGCLYGELGHPKKDPGWSIRDFIMRVATIFETNVCAHFKEIRINDKLIKDDQGRFMIAVIGKVKPHGPHGHVLKDALENKCQNVCFSVRSLVDERTVGSLKIRSIRSLITFDYVLEPGIHIAKKWFSPAMECLGDAISVTKKFLGELLGNVEQTEVAMESNTRDNLENIRKDLGLNITKSKVPPSSRWQ